MERRMPTVAVLMSTYNGQLYIREQLDSIFAQKDVIVRLFVRDDGSTDDTVEILKEYAKNHSMELLLDGGNVGPGESFLRLVYKYAAEPGVEYYAFADQDDIWMDDKLAVAVHMIQSMDDGGPVLYASNQTIYTDGTVKGNRYEKPQRTDLISHLSINTISGCTFVFNKKLAVTIANAERPDSRIIKYRIHDSWIMLIAIASGHVIYDEQSHIYYRIHANNTVGIKKIGIKEKISKIDRLIHKRESSNQRSLTARELLRLFENNITMENKKKLRLFAEYQLNWKNKVALMNNQEIIEGVFERPLVFRIKVLLNMV